MKFNINKTIKNNVYFFLILYSYLVLCLFMGNFVAMPGTGGREVTFYNLAESFFYTFFNTITIIKVYTQGDIDSLFVILHLGLIIPFLFYIVIPLLTLLKIEFKENYFLWTDIICFMIYTLITMLGISFFGILFLAIPIAIIYFRIYQYKKKLIF